MIVEETPLNWSIPKKHYFNFAGWYHAVFFILMFGVLGFLFVRYFRIKMADNGVDSIAGMISQFLIWLSGSLFIFLHFIDDYNNFGMMLITLLAFLVVALVLYIITLKTRFKILNNSDVMALLSGMASAFAIANIIVGHIHIHWMYVASCALILVILVVPDVDNIKK